MKSSLSSSSLPSASFFLPVEPFLAVATAFFAFAELVFPPLLPVPAVEGVEDVDAAFFLAAAEEVLPGCLPSFPDVGGVLVRGINRSSSSGSDLSS